MRTISLDSLQAENFKSYHKAEITFTLDPGLKYLGGENLVEPELGANGAGKSSLWDALFWCLYGVSIRDGRASDLVTWTAKRPIVVASFDIDGTRHIISRTGNPNKVYIDGKEATQDAVEALVGLTKARFRHSVMFGQAVPFFIDLSATERAVILDEVLDQEIWNDCAVDAAQEARQCRDAERAAQMTIQTITGRIEVYRETAARLAEQSAQWDAEYTARVEKAIEACHAAYSELQPYEDWLAQTAPPDANTHNVGISEDWNKTLDDIHVHLTDLDQARKANLARQFTIRDIARPNAKPTRCPTCGQAMPQDQSHTHKADLRKEYAQLEAGLAYIDDQIGQWQTTRDTILGDRSAALAAHQTALAQYRETEATWTHLRTKYDTIYNNTERLMAENVNPFPAQITAINDQETAATDELNNARKAAADQAAEAEVLEFWAKAFKRIRYFQIQQVLERMTVETANAASLLGIGDWTIEFSVDHENKSGGTRHGIYIVPRNAEGHAVNELSGGEGQRVKLAVAVGLASLIQEMSGVEMTFEVWDEPSAWLNEDGIEALLETLRGRAENHAKAVWLLDHRVLSYPGFTERWVARKTTDGSQLERVM